MVDGRLAEQWKQASWLMAAAYNSQPGRKTAIQPHKLNPYQGLAPPPEDDDLDDVFGLDEDDGEAHPVALR